jgi:hypothetical protein
VIGQAPPLSLSLAAPDGTAAAATRLAAALASSSYRSHDPYDALASPLLRTACRTPLLRQAAIQALKRSPLNARRLLGVPRLVHTKALALLVSAHARLAQLDGGEPHAALACELAGCLAERAIERPAGAGFGYDFDVQTRWGYYRRGEPNAVVTAFAANALLDAEELGAAALGTLARAVCDFACAELLVDVEGSCFFAYVPGSCAPIHNANMLLAGVLVRSGRSEESAHAIAYTLERQRVDGSWPYGEAPGLDWVDGFHTAYVLEGLHASLSHAGDQAVRSALERGLDFYVSRLFDRDAAPRASITARYPIDIHAASSAITALVRLRAYDDRALTTADAVLCWALRHMQRRDGRFAFQRHRFYRNSVPYVRWSDAHMLHALGTRLAAAQEDAGAA